MTGFFNDLLRRSPTSFFGRPLAQAAGDTPAAPARAELVADQEPSPVGARQPSEEAAARAGIGSVFDQAQKSGWEYSGALYKDASGNYGFTPAGTQSSRYQSAPLHTPIPTDSALVGYYLVKVGPTPDTRFSAEQIEFPDKAIADKRNVRAYVASPSGRFQRYDPDRTLQMKGPVTELRAIK